MTPTKTTSFRAGAAEVAVAVGGAGAFPAQLRYDRASRALVASVSRLRFEARLERGWEQLTPEQQDARMRERA
jgi:hypothetical protein